MKIVETMANNKFQKQLDRLKTDSAYKDSIMNLYGDSPKLHGIPDSLLLAGLVNDSGIEDETPMTTANNVKNIDIILTENRV